ncbi:MAG: VCBS repeat-containing protein [Desulfobacteraceae bacterium]|nr:VCBS repeat-containing protein [Desulfobacteraceae bacterium]
MSIRVMVWIRFILILGVMGCGGSGGGGNASSGPDGIVSPGGSSTGGERNPVCNAGQSTGEVRQPVFVRNLNGQTSWFASPVVEDLDGDGSNELIAAYYSLYAFSADGSLLDRADGNGSRIYAPHVVTDLEGDGIFEIVCGQGRHVYAYEWTDNGFSIKSGWPADTTTAGNSPEVRGLAAADLEGNGSIEIIATTTQTTDTGAGGAQVFVFDYTGHSYQPADTGFQAWPRYNAGYGDGGDADRNGAGHHGFGCYGLNVGVGDIDDDPEMEIIVTYDNHHIQAFDHDGEAIDAAPWFSNRHPEYAGNRMTWGQFIRWTDPDVEADHYHFHQGDWPHPSSIEWLQWTASPPHVADLDLDGDNEVIGMPNVEYHVPYETQAYAIMVLEGAHGNGERSAMRKPGWEVLPRGSSPIDVDGWYPPGGVPAAAIINIQGDATPEIVVSLNDGFMSCYTADAQLLWRYNYTYGKPIMYASEPMVADLNQDGSPEVIFSTYGDPDVLDSGHLIVLAADGSLLHELPLPDPGANGNGNGAPAAPTIADLDNDGQLEILVQTFEHGMDIFTIPGSGCDCMLWSTARGGPLRMGQPSGNH